MKILPVGAELFQAGGRTDTNKLIVAFNNFANAPKRTRDIIKNRCWIFYDLAMNPWHCIMASTYLVTPPRLDLTFPLGLMFTAVQTLSYDVTSIHGVINC
jgi:hypothetical protein